MPCAQLGVPEKLGRVVHEWRRHDGNATQHNIDVMSPL
jgi:hypothetical protein